MVPGLGRGAFLPAADSVNGRRGGGGELGAPGADRGARVRLMQTLAEMGGMKSLPAMTTAKSHAILDEPTGSRPRAVPPHLWPGGARSQDPGSARARDHTAARDVRRQPVWAVVHGVDLPAEAAREPARGGLPFDQQDLPLLPYSASPSPVAPAPRMTMRGGRSVRAMRSRSPVRSAGRVVRGGCGRAPELLCWSDGGLKQQKEAVAVAGGARGR